eukprot:Gb_14343 [translate_table: standard]
MCKKLSPIKSQQQDDDDDGDGGGGSSGNEDNSDVLLLKSHLHFIECDSPMNQLSLVPLKDQVSSTVQTLSSTDPSLHTIKIMPARVLEQLVTWIVSGNLASA